MGKTKNKRSDATKRRMEPWEKRAMEAARAALRPRSEEEQKLDAEELNRFAQDLALSIANPRQWRKQLEEKRMQDPEWRALHQEVQRRNLWASIQGTILILVLLWAIVGTLDEIDKHGLSYVLDQMQKVWEDGTDFP
jgi:hypothetical protein